MLIMDKRFSHLRELGLLTTIMKSCSAFGPNLRVILLVSSFEIGFSMNQASCLISLFTMLSDFFPFSQESASREKGRSGLLNFSPIYFLLNQKLFESIANSTIYSEFVRFPTFKVDPNNFPGKKVEQLRMRESTQMILLTSTRRDFLDYSCFLLLLLSRSEKGALFFSSCAPGS